MGFSQCSYAKLFYFLFFDKHLCVCVSRNRIPRMCLSHRVCVCRICFSRIWFDVCLRAGAVFHSGCVFVYIFLCSGCVCVGVRCKAEYVMFV